MIISYHSTLVRRNKTPLINENPDISEKIKYNTNKIISFAPKYPLRVYIYGR